ncbi:MAG TPA: lipid-binding SYLF domain-containing protein [Alphaproteobacteria bacterium]|jgi:lipid-binding SYLF domain-containing protein|nr:lipid-binding SYLF domain-containing protein [Alphaproteobacteria bacterium]
MPIGRRHLIMMIPAASIVLAAGEAWASAQEIDADASAALQRLYAKSTKARDMAKTAKGILIFPNIVKAGFLVGAQSGDGVLRIGGKSTAYFNISAGSFGLQAGVQSFSYAMFFMTQSALDYLDKSDGWQVGSGPSVVVIDKGAAASTTSTTLSQDVYAFPFGQKGLMAGLGLEGSKITHIKPS